MEKREVETPKREKEKPLHVVEPLIASDNTIMRDQCLNEIPSDVDGSYTGTAADGSRPVQDADDL